MTQNHLPQITNPNTNVAGQTFWIVLPPKFSVSYSTLIAALNNAGMDTGLGLSLADTYAFNRAVSLMARGKLKDRVEWSQDRVSIQVSARIAVPGGIDYIREATVTFDRGTKTVICSDPAVKAEAETQLNAAQGKRSATDVNRLLERAIRPHVNTDVFPMKGGVYFALNARLGFVDGLERFVSDIGGKLVRWDIADGTQQTQATVQTVVVDSLAETIAEVQTHIGTVNSESREDKVERVQRTLADLEVKLKGNARLIGDQLARLEDDLAYLETLLVRNRHTAPGTVLSETPPEGEAASSVPFSPEPVEEEFEDAPQPDSYLPESERYTGPLTVGKASDLVHVNDPFLFPAPLDV